jgi:hypothetical protein
MPVLERSAVLDFGNSNPDRYAYFLSAEELSWIRTFRNRERQQQSMSARLCLKYLFLLQMDSCISDRVVRIRDEELNRYPEWLYREISLIVDRPHAGRRFTWCGTRFPGISVSLSHSHSICGASFSTDRRVGMDVEIVERRSHSFCRSYFSHAERTWVETHSSSVDAAWLYTLLWSLKESGLKTAASELGFSDIARLEVSRFPDCGKLLEIYKSGSFSLDPVRFSVDIRGVINLDNLDCELTGDRKQVVIVARQNILQGR